MNLSRKKFISLFIAALIRGRSVQFTEIATHMDTDSLNSSNHRRIQDFFAEYELDYVQIAILLYCCLPRWGNLTLAIDRTNWSFGQTDINFLVITAYCNGVGIPLWFEQLGDGKRGGNSNEAERMQAMSYCIKIFGRSRKIVLCGDREFIGDGWIGWLIEKEIDFFLRIRKNMYITYQGEKRHAWEWLENWKFREMENCLLGSHKVSVAIKSLPKSTDGDKHLIVVSNTPVQGVLKTYKKRWSIEVFFQAIKGRGFNMEKTHLTDFDRLRKLFALVSIAFALCLKIGIWADKHIKTIEIKNHGYKANSFFRHGLEKWREALRTGRNIYDFIRIFELIWGAKLRLKFSP